MNNKGPAAELKKRMSRVCDGGGTASDLEAVEGLLLTIQGRSISTRRSSPTRRHSM